MILNVACVEKNCGQSQSFKKKYLINTRSSFIISKLNFNFTWIFSYLFYDCEDWTFPRKKKHVVIATNYMSKIFRQHLCAFM